MRRLPKEVSDSAIQQFSSSAVQQFSNSAAVFSDDSAIQQFRVNPDVMDDVTCCTFMCTIRTPSRWFIGRLILFIRHQLRWPSHAFPLNSGCIAVYSVYSDPNALPHRADKSMKYWARSAVVFIEKSFLEYFSIFREYRFLVHATCGLYHTLFAEIFIVRRLLPSIRRAECWMGNIILMCRTCTNAFFVCL